MLIKLVNPVISRINNFKYQKLSMVSPELHSLLITINYHYPEIPRISAETAPKQTEDLVLKFP
jgi:hypothetical protein